jgi:hypothetical protein
MKHSKIELRRIRMVTKGKPLTKYRSVFDGNVKERNKNVV